MLRSKLASIHPLTYFLLGRHQLLIQNLQIQFWAYSRTLW